MKASFKPRARLLKLLGDQLIGTSQLAIFELVKNSYDADAEKVEVVIKNPENPQTASIEITDFGAEGMDVEVIENVWLEPGADHKDILKKSGVRTKKHKRLPLGEKGVGRFAVHKLGKKIHLLSKKENSPEVSLEIDWDQLEKFKYIDDAEIEIKENEPPIFFKDGLTGTKIIISDLHNEITRSDVRKLHRNIQSIKSPFEYKELKLEKLAPDFDVTLKVEGHEDWTDDLLDMHSIISQALFKFTFMIESDGTWSWFYEFNPTEALKKEYKVEPSKKSESEANFELMKVHSELLKDNKDSFYNDLGLIIGEIYVFDFDSEVRKFYSEAGAIKNYLSENKGIRVYRDGIRVYNYGEPSDDWLEMDRSRVQRIAVNLNRDITIGAISLDLESTSKLIEKTNREGFIENEAFFKLRAVVQSAVDKFQKLRLLDKDRLRAITNSDVHTSVKDIHNPIQELKDLAEKNGWAKEIQPTLQRIEKSYNDMQDIMLSAGMAGLNLSVAFHELYRGVRDTKRMLQTEMDKQIVIKQFERFELLLDTYANLLKKEKSKEIKISELLQINLQLANARFFMHDIIHSCPVLTNEEPDFTINVQHSLITSVINNIIDNSIYWLDHRWGVDHNKKYIYIGVSEAFDKGPAIIIADNGPGLRNISSEEIVKPFKTTKPGGMGIGLYFADTVMEMMGGELVILNNTEDIAIPHQADGAVVALVFNGGEKCKK